MKAAYCRSWCTSSLALKPSTTARASQRPHCAPDLSSVKTQRICEAQRRSTVAAARSDSGPSESGGEASPEEDGSLAERLPGQTSAAEASTSYSGSPEEQQNRFLQVPWKGPVIWRVMLLWTFAYVIHPQWIIPLGLELFVGIDREQLGARGEALLHMVMDLGMLGFSIAILWVCLRKYRPRARGWFRSRAWPPSWTLKVLLACLFAFPLAMFLADFSETLIPVTESELCNAVHLEHTIRAGDMITKALYFLVLTVCAPIWEEVIFRGFLMPSLTRYMPLWTAVLTSALIFACVHFSFRRFLVLALLGLVFGALYAESRNLIAAIAAHSLWNLWVLVQFLLEEARPVLPV